MIIDRLVVSLNIAACVQQPFFAEYCERAGISTEEFNNATAFLVKNELLVVSDDRFRLPFGLGISEARSRLKKL